MFNNLDGTSVQIVGSGIKQQVSQVCEGHGLSDRELPI